MTGTAVTVIRGSQPVMRLNTANIDFDLIGKYADAMRGSNRMPGTLLSYSLGEYIVGFGNTKKVKKHPIEAVANIPNLMFAWRKFTEAGLEMPCFCYPLIGEALPPRSEMGDLDRSEWENQTDSRGKVEYDDDGNPRKRDPWQQVAILMLRLEKTGELLRFETASVSGKSAVIDLVQEYAGQAKRNPDKLPVIVMDSQKLKQKGTNNKYDAPLFEIVDWVDPTDEDFPEGGVSLAPETDEVTDAGRGKANTRSTKKAAARDDEEAAPRRGRRAAAAEDDDAEETPRRGRRAAAAEETEDDDAEETPRRGRGRRAAAAEETEDDDAEETPRRGRGRRAAAAEDDAEETPRRGRRAAAVEDDDEGDDEPAPARSRRRVTAA